MREEWRIAGEDKINRKKEKKKKGEVGRRR